jgi:hypothetical protein
MGSQPSGAPDLSRRFLKATKAVQSGIGHFAGRFLILGEVMVVRWKGNKPGDEGKGTPLY